MSRTSILILGIAALFLIGVAFSLYHLRDAGKREVVNQYRSEAFSFTYPLGLEIEESSDGTIAIGSTTPGGFDSAVDLTSMTPGEVVAEGEVVSELPPFLSNLCVSTSVTERTYCEREESRQTITTKSGAEAQEYYLILTRERVGGEPERITYGPIYLYITPPMDPEAESGYSVLVVSNPLESVLASVADTALLTRIKDSITVEEEAR